MAKKKSRFGKLQTLREDALKYIRKILEKRGTNYELTDPANYEDEVEDSVYELPRGTHVDKHFNYFEFPIVVVDIDTDGNLTFQGLNIGEYDDDKTFGEDDMDTANLLCIADLIEQLEGE